MKLVITNFELNGSVSNYIVVHPATANNLDLDPGSLVKLEDGEQGFQLILSVHIDQGCAGLSQALMTNLSFKVGDPINFRPTGVEGVTRIIRKKMSKQVLTKDEISIFMNAIDKGLLSDGHIGSFGTAVEINGLSMDEVSFVAEAILDTSKKLSLKNQPIVDKHSIGGIAGNRITPIMVPVIAAAGLTIPKVSTRAITSPAGTTDALEVVMPVELSLSEANDAVNSTNGCMVDGLKIGLGSVADKFLRVVKQVKIDPQEMMIASILAKKKAAGSSYVLIDLPTGPGSKLPTREDARKLAYDFSTVGHRLGLRIESVVSPGDKPIGTKIGPSLEITEALQILKQVGGAYNLRRKALSLAGLIFENVGKAERGKGYDMAKRILKSGKAYEKFKEISVAQGGPEDFKIDDLPQSNYKHAIMAEDSDKVYSVDSFNIGMMARAAGAPQDNSAGIEIHVDRGDIVKLNQPLITIHANSESKLSDAIALMHTAPPFSMEKAVLEYITGLVE